MNWTVKRAEPGEHATNCIKFTTKAAPRYVFLPSATIARSRLRRVTRSRRLAPIFVKELPRAVRGLLSCTCNCRRLLYAIYVTSEHRSSVSPSSFHRYTCRPPTISIAIRLIARGSLPRVLGNRRSRGCSPQFPASVHCLREPTAENIGRAIRGAIRRLRRSLRSRTIRPLLIYRRSTESASDNKVFSLRLTPPSYRIPLYPASRRKLNALPQHHFAQT